LNLTYLYIYSQISQNNYHIQNNSQFHNNQNLDINQKITIFTKIEISLKKTLVLFAHPYFEHSTTNVRLLECYGDLENVTFRDLYEDYPDFHIQPFRERKRIVEYQRIIFHFPIIWFGLPPLLKLWIDEVFDMRWITETGLNILSGKDALIVTSVGGRELNYAPDGKFKTTIEELLSGLKVSLQVNNIDLKKIHVIYNDDNLSEDELAIQCQELSETLKLK